MNSEEDLKIIAKREAFKRVFKKYYALRLDDVIVDAFIRELEEAGLNR